MAPHTPHATRPGGPGALRDLVVLKGRLVVATLNRAKGRELLDLLGNVPYELLLLADVPGATLPEETGKTYAENALIKARAGALATGVIALADDSGIEVDALDGGPGLYSARFGGPGLDDAGRTALLLERLRGVSTERRTACSPRSPRARSRRTTY